MSGDSDKRRYDVIAETRKGRQVVNLRPGATLVIVRPIAPNHDAVATVGNNRRLLVFPLSELPEMGRRGQSLGPTTWRRRKDCCKRR